MSTDNLYLAVFVGSKTGPKQAAWNALSEAERRARERGIEDTSNALAAFHLVRAESHEAAVRLLEDRPHFTIFPGDAVEVMPILPVPGR